MTEIEHYVVNCIKNKTKIGGRKLSGHSVDLEKCYQLATGEVPPRCAVCDETTKFISVKNGYRKFCSKTCYSVHMGERNKITNSTLNEKNAERNAEASKKCESIVLKYISENPLKTQKECAKDTGFSLYQVRKIMGVLGSEYISNRKADLLRNNNDNKFSTVNDFLMSPHIVNMVDSGYTCKMLSEMAGCSPNYVATFIRNNRDDITWNNSTSSHEILVRRHFEHIQHTVNDRSVIPPLEIDLYFPEKHVGVEINGLYWHSQKDKKYHLDKLEKFDGRLLQFTDKEVEEKEDIVISIIKSSLGISDRIYARKCSVVELNSNQYKEFCENNHIQGSINASIKLGLEFNGHLVAVMGLGKSRFNQNHEYELYRYCNSIGKTVVGGMSKLFSYFAKEYTPKSVISYAQKRLYSGKSYENIGMSHTRDTPPNYVWVRGGKDVVTRYQSQMKNETQVMTERGYRKYYDCGQKVYEIVF